MAQIQPTQLKLLFVHQGFPGQYLHILHALAAEGHELVGLGLRPPSDHLPTSLKYIQYSLHRGNAKDVHPWALDLESKVLRGEACARTAAELKASGFHPDLICGHPGWGETLCLGDVWPDVPLLTYQEFFYQSHGFDSHFDSEMQPEPDWQSTARLHLKTANTLLNLERSRWCITPTRFQRSSFPQRWHSQISVIHDGINTKRLQPAQHAGALQLPDGSELEPATPLITFVNRHMEPYRGCHTMIRAIPALQALVPNAHLVLVGSTTGTSYGRRCPKGEWNDHFLAEIKNEYDPSKVHFTGSLPYATYIELLQRSSVHVYLTYPFVLSWSLLEAMSCGCAVVGSDTAPVREVIEPERNGLLVDFFDPQALASSIASLVKDRDRAAALGRAARQTVLDHYELNACLQQHLALIKLVANGGLAP